MSAGKRYAVTGHREGESPVVTVALSGLDDVSELTTGVQYGVDTFAYFEGLRLHPDALHRVVVPTVLPLLGRPRYNVDVERRQIELRATDPRYELLYVHDARGLGPDVWCYFARNGMMLDRCEVLLAFPETAKEVARGSGTWATIRDARRRGVIEVRVFPLDESDPWVENAQTVLWEEFDAHGGGFL